MAQGCERLRQGLAVKESVSLESKTVSEPIRLNCTSDRDIPSAEEIAGQVTDDRHLVLMFPVTSPTEIDKRTIIDRLSSELPEYSVFDSGGAEGMTWITIMRMVSTETVEAYATKIIAAARLFHELATDLMTRLAVLPPKQRIGCEGFQWRTQLPG